MKNLAKLSFFVFVVTFAFAACETKNAENTTEHIGDVIEADVETTKDSLKANLNQAADATEEAVEKAASEFKEGANELGAEIEETKK